MLLISDISINHFCLRRNRFPSTTSSRDENYRYILGNANEMLIARGTGAIDARIDVSDIVANGAEAEVGLDVAYSGGESFGIFVAGAENVEREALSAFGAYAGELFKLVD
jgi:hypothetical protein